MPALLLGSDEFGQHYFPQSDYAWDEVGEKTCGKQKLWNRKKSYELNSKG